MVTVTLLCNIKHTVNQTRIIIVISSSNWPSPLCEQPRWLRSQCKRCRQGTKTTQLLPGMLQAGRISTCSLSIQPATRGLLLSFTFTHHIQAEHSD